MQCFFDQLIGDMRPIKVAGVDVIDSERNDLAQDCDRAVVIFWWPEYMWTSELHGAVAHASQDQIIGKLECAAGQVGGGHRFSIRDYELRIRNKPRPLVLTFRRSQPQPSRSAPLSPPDVRAIDSYAPAHFDLSVCP